MKSLSQVVLDNQNNLHHSFFKEQKRFTTNSIMDLFWNIYNPQNQFHLIAGKNLMGVHNLLMHVAYQTSKSMKVLIWSKQNEFTITESLLNNSLTERKQNWNQSVLDENFKNISFKSDIPKELINLENLEELNANIDLLIIDNSEPTNLTSNSSLPSNIELLNTLKQISARKNFDVVCSCGIPEGFQELTNNFKTETLQQVGLPNQAEELFETITCLFRPEFFNIDYDEFGNSTRGLAELYHLKNEFGKKRKEVLSFNTSNGVFKSPQNSITYLNENQVL